LVTFKATGKNDDGSTVGTLTVYNQSHADVQIKGFSGNDIYNLPPIGKGNYMMNLSQRDADGPGRLVPDGHGSYKPEPYGGIQKIPNDAQFEYKGQYFPMNPTVTDAYGNGRIRLNQTDADLNVVPLGQQPAGYYLHGKGAAVNYTHGCVCDKSEEVFNYFWSGEGKDVRGYIPFVVE
jgi:hypothetical protein